MRRPKTPAPLALSDLRYDPAKSLYYRTQNGITYYMPLELTRHLKEFYRTHYKQTGKLDYPSMEDWYNELKKDQKNKVVRTGNLPLETTDFFPDMSYE